MILNIHGFASSGENSKSKLLLEYNKNVISPTLPIDPTRSLKILNDIIQSNDITLIVGTSMGGFYANLLSNKYNISSILINPSTKPSVTLGKKVGVHKNYKTNEEFELTQEHINIFKEIEITQSFDLGFQTVLLGEHDDVIDPTIADQLFTNADVKWFNTDHRFSELKTAIETNDRLKKWVTT